MLAGLRSLLGTDHHPPGAAASVTFKEPPFSPPFSSPISPPKSPNGPYSPRRTSTHAPFRSHCSERNVAPEYERYPVKLVVFDVDETLTLVSYMIDESDSLETQRQLLKVNFESPWVPGSRLAKLQNMLQDLLIGSRGQQRTLAILTRNNAGAEAVLRLMRAAKLDHFFTVIWTMPWRDSMRNGAYREGTTWYLFDPPLTSVKDHKADVLNDVGLNPEAWFPQLANGSDKKLEELLNLRLEGIVLVDDQRANFQSPSGAQVLRYCKIARYDARYRSLGFIKNMGGIGAHNDADYETLKSFVEAPSMCKETLQLHCVELPSQGTKDRLPISLVIFDFDETLTLSTFMPEDYGFAEDLNFDASTMSEWNEAELLAYNFESPFVRGSRLDKLRMMLDELKLDQEGNPRTLAILTRNEQGVVAVLNLLKIARLSDLFAAVWTMPYSAHRPTGAFQYGGEWHCFEAPVIGTPDHKADVLQAIVENTEKWFPQLSLEKSGSLRGLQDLRLEAIVLVDDERASFQSSQTTVLRYCKVARYDEDYRSCGLLNQMGGIGAHSDNDYDTLKSFLDQPWLFLIKENTSSPPEDSAPLFDSLTQQENRRECHLEEFVKMPRARSMKKSNSTPDINKSPKLTASRRSNSFSVPLICPEEGPEFDLVLISSSGPTSA